jgi:hypothetical protein
MSDYTISVKNQSGEDVKVAIYQAYPAQDGLSLVWLRKQINEDNSTDFNWEINWGLNWGTTDQKLAPGVQWNSHGPAQDMNPTAAKGTNAMGVVYSGSEFRTDPKAYNDPNVESGSMQVKTDDSFSVKQAKAMSLAVYMNGLPAFAMQGQPRGTFTFATHPTYYICTTDHKQGVAVTGNFVSNPTEIVFAAGVTTLSYVLNDELEFVLQS